MTPDATIAPSRAVMLCGAESADPPGRLLHCGQLRYVRFGGVEVLRGVAFLAPIEAETGQGF